jgi:hypothetical protein
MRGSRFESIRTASSAERAPPATRAHAGADARGRQRERARKRGASSPPPPPLRHHRKEQEERANKRHEEGQGRGEEASTGRDKCVPCVLCCGVLWCACCVCVCVLGLSGAMWPRPLVPTGRREERVKDKRDGGGGRHTIERKERKGAAPRSPHTTPCARARACACVCVRVTLCALCASVCCVCSSFSPTRLRK